MWTPLVVLVHNNIGACKPDNTGHAGALPVKFVTPPPPPTASTKWGCANRWRGGGTRAPASLSRLGLLARCPGTWDRKHGGRHTHPQGRKGEGHRQGYGALEGGILHPWGKNRKVEPRVGQPANGWWKNRDSRATDTTANPRTQRHAKVKQPSPRQVSQHWACHQLCSHLKPQGYTPPLPGPV